MDIWISKQVNSRYLRRFPAGARRLIGLILAGARWYWRVIWSWNVSATTRPGRTCPLQSLNLYVSRQIGPLFCFDRIQVHKPGWFIRLKIPAEFAEYGVLSVVREETIGSIRVRPECPAWLAGELGPWIRIFCIVHQIICRDLSENSWVLGENKRVNSSDNKERKSREWGKTEKIGVKRESERMWFLERES